MSLLLIQYVGEVGSSGQNGVPPKTKVLCSTYHGAQGIKLVYSVFHKYLDKTLILGGSCQMLTIDDKGGGRGVKNPKNLLT